MCNIVITCVTLIVILYYIIDLITRDAWNFCVSSQSAKVYWNELNRKVARHFANSVIVIEELIESYVADERMVSCTRGKYCSKNYHKIW